MLLGLGLRILLGVAAGAAVAAVCIYVHGKITAKKLQREMAKRNIQQFLIREIDKCDNVIKLSDIDNENEFIIRGDSIDRKLKEGIIIYT